MFLKHLLKTTVSGSNAITDCIQLFFFEAADLLVFVTITILYYTLENGTVSDSTSFITNVNKV